MDIVGFLAYVEQSAAGGWSRQRRLAIDVRPSPRLVTVLARSLARWLGVLAADGHAGTVADRASAFRSARRSGELDEGDLRGSIELFLGGVADALVVCTRFCVCQRFRLDAGSLVV